MLGYYLNFILLILVEFQSLDKRDERERKKKIRKKCEK